MKPAEIVLDQNDGLGVREVDVGQVFQDVSVIHGGMAIGDLDMAPAYERSKHHEEIGGAIALILIIETGRASRFHRDRHARFGNDVGGDGPRRRMPTLSMTATRSNAPER